MAVATFPRQYVTIPDALRALEGWLLALRFVAAPFGRDPRLDLLRGFCIFAMVVNHIGGTSWLYVITGGNAGPVTAAEGFVFLSGLVLGMVSRKRVLKDGLRAAVRSTLRRARTLYLTTVALTLIFLGLTVGTELSMWVDRGLLGEIENWPLLIGSVATLRFSWHGADILTLYTLLLAASPLALLLLASGRPFLLLALSWSLWLGYQFAPELLILPWRIEHAATFPFAAWQALFFSALALGYCQQELTRWFARESARPHGAGLAYRLGLGAAAIGLVLLGVVLTTDHAHAMPGAASIAGTSALPLLGPDLFDKPSLGLGRIVAFASLAVAAFVTVTLFWQPIERLTGWLLIPLGQASLYAYVVHLFLIVVAYNVPPYVGSTQEGWELHNTLGQFAFVLLLWLMVKRKALFGLIPR